MGACLPLIASSSWASSPMRISVAQDPSLAIFSYPWGRTQILVRSDTDRQYEVYEQFRFALNGKRSFFSIAMKHNGLLGEYRRITNPKPMGDWQKDASGTWILKTEQGALHFLNADYFKSQRYSWAPRVRSAADERSVSESKQIELRWNEKNPDELSLILFDSDRGIMKTVILSKLVCSSNHCREKPELSQNEWASLNR